MRTPVMRAGPVTIEEDSVLWMVLRRVVLLMLCVLAAVAGVLPLGAAASEIAVAPAASLLVLWAWGVMRPVDVSAWLVFLVGLLVDALTGGPIGLWALGFLAAHVVASIHRDTFEKMSGLAVWLAFATGAGVAAGSAWGIAGLYYWRLFDPRPLVWGFGAVVLAFPLLLAIVRRRSARHKRRGLKWA